LVTILYERRNILKHKRYKDYHKEVDNVLYKKCTDCNEWFEASESNFGINKNTKSGFNERCKSCQAIHNHNKYESNKEKYKESIIQKIKNNELYNSEFNDYILEGEIIKLILKTKNKEVITIIDTDELERVKSLGLRWTVKNISDSQQQYARAGKWELVNGELKLKSYYLHILLADVKNGGDVDHINHNTLDNRKSNLREITTSENTRNRKSKNTNNKSGYRNVCWNKQKEQWMVQLHLEGKNKILGYFDNVDEAGVFAEQMRKKYYGEFAGKS
jgi:hypothetical protein